MTGPESVLIYVCQGCSQWTSYRRKRCCWCASRLPLLALSYVPAKGAS